jgi:hypothetical protein
MILSNPEANNWSDALKIINRCPICQANYTGSGARLFAQFQAARLVHITCGKCQSFFVAMIASLGQGLSSVGMITDLNYEDAKNLYLAEPITIDELIEGYQCLNGEAFYQTIFARER